MHPLNIGARHVDVVTGDLAEIYSRDITEMYPRCVTEMSPRSTLAASSQAIKLKSLARRAISEFVPLNTALQVLRTALPQLVAAATRQVGDGWHGEFSVDEAIAALEEARLDLRLELLVDLRPILELLVDL